MANVIGTAGEAWAEVYAAPFNGIVKLISGSPKAIGCVGSDVPGVGDVGFAIGRAGTEVTVLSGESLYLRSYRGVVEVMLTPQASPADFLYEIGDGNIPGKESNFIIASSNKVMSTESSTVWDVGGNYEYLTANTQLYVSSTSTLDVGNLIVSPGLDDAYVMATAIAFTNGQEQVPMSIELFRVFVSLVGNEPGLVGDVYIAEADTLTGGVPDTPSKIKNMIPRSTNAQGAIIDGGTVDFDSDNISHLGLYTVPAGYTMKVIDIYPGTVKNDDLKIGARVKLLGGPWLNRNPVNAYQSQFRVNFQALIVLPEKAEFEVRAVSGSDNSSAQFQVIFILQKTNPEV